MNNTPKQPNVFEFNLGPISIRGYGRFGTLAAMTVVILFILVRVIAS